MGIFNSISSRRPKLSKFDLSHERKLSLTMGNLIPILCLETVPGDRFRLSSEIMMRFAPMLAPIMHRVNVYTHYFFVPNRLIWNEWEDFITGGRDGTLSPVVPHFTVDQATIDASLYGAGSVADHLGFPSQIAGAGVTDPINISALPFRAYHTIYNEFYRDQNLEPEVAFSINSGNVNADRVILSTMRKRAWEKDYFTSALPWTQRGGDVSLPITNSASVSYSPVSSVFRGDGTNPLDDKLLGVDSTGVGTPPATGKGLIVDRDTSTSPATGTFGRIENIAGVNVNSTSVTINELRRSIRLQEWLEKNARGGARYIEQILSHFGVKSSDGRLQRPEYLGGGKSPCVISEVLSTVESTDGSVPQANMAGHGYSVGNTNGFSRRFEEHGFVVGLMSVLPRTAYQQGVPKMFSRIENKFDYYWPEFAQLGEQPIVNRELYYNPRGVSGVHNGTFGYQSRYAEYKYVPSTVHGEMRTTLSHWHMGRIFASQPALNASFVQSDPTNRIFAVTGAGIDNLYCQIFHKFSALRPMPYFGTPVI